LYNLDDKNKFFDGHILLETLAWKDLLRNITGNGLNPYGKNSTC
jgi:hypothetical protein